MIVTIGGIVMMFIPVIAWNLRRSRCTHLKCCCAECERELMTLDEQKNDKLQKNMFSI